MKLYYFSPSPNSRKVQAIALHLDSSLDLELVNLQQGDQRHPDFLALNPTGRIPVLQDGEFVLWESNAIMQYLANQASIQGLGNAQAAAALWPNDARLRADITRWQSWQLAHWVKGCQPLNYERFVKRVLGLGKPDEQVVQQALAVFHREAALLNGHLASRDYLVDDHLTLADFSVASDLTYADVAEFPLADYPHIQAWYSRMEALPAWQKTAPQRPQ